MERNMRVWLNQLRRVRAIDDRGKERDAKRLAEEARAKRRGHRKKKQEEQSVKDQININLESDMDKKRARRGESEAHVIRKEEEKEQEERQRINVMMNALNLGASAGQIEAHEKGGGVQGDAFNNADSEAAELLLKAMKEKEDERLKAIEDHKQRDRKEKEAEAYLRTHEEKVTTPRSGARRRLLRLVHVAMRRQEDGFVLCDWNCGVWMRRGRDQLDHQKNQCIKRILPCSLGCKLRLSEEEWLKMKRYRREVVMEVQDDEQFPQIEDFEEEKKEHSDNFHSDHQQQTIGESGQSRPSTGKKEFVPFQQIHEETECPRRLVPCRLKCGEWVAFEDLETHMLELCVKRPANPIMCRFGCGKVFGGSLEKMISAEEDRIEHENEACEFRNVRCTWPNCGALVKADERKKHRDKHIESLGITLYRVPGTYVYVIPKKVIISIFFLLIFIFHIYTLDLPAETAGVGSWRREWSFLQKEGWRWWRGIFC